MTDSARNLVVGLVAGLCCGCSEKAPPAPDDAAPAPAQAEVIPAPDVPDDATRVLSNDGAFHVAFRLLPDPAPLNEPFDLEVWLLDARSDGGVAGDLVIDGRMPHHKHGMNVEPSVTRRDDGSYLVEGMLFHMPGYWELHFDVTRDGLTERAQSSLELD